MENALYETKLKNLERISQGKVRDIYKIDNQNLLIITSDRLSTFDVVLPDPIPGKGAVLTQLSNFWFERTKDIIPNHLTEKSLTELPLDNEELESIKDRAIIVKHLNPLPVEAVVRGYLIGSGWKDYQSSGKVCGILLPEGLEQAAQLPEPIFTPATKAAVGDHDENIDFATMSDLIGTELAQQVKELSIQIYLRGVEYARTKEIIIADTKFEFGLDDDGKLYLIDEVLTPDSSRFWPANEYQTGISPPSFDKQFVRDYLETVDWNKTAPGPKLPNQVIDNTAKKYRQALDQLIS
ncbi:MAG: phosphoribosylaminoimidazolesuccinocarboxamide synthase [Pseudomonadota bacterium]|nr:phosphoribosylaminoimidazolesuccinocarboxamide synthase [Pseudomonadota bacterium]